MNKASLIYIVSKIAEAAVRRAAGLPVSYDDMPLSLREAAKTIAEIVAEQIAFDDGITLRCRLCGKGPFTKKGLYLHLKRVHLDIVQEMVKRELEEYLWRRKNYNV